MLPSFSPDLLALPRAMHYSHVTMQPLQAIVKNGRIVLDAPTDLPEGAAITLIALEELLAEAGDTDDSPVSFRVEFQQPNLRRRPGSKMLDAAALIDELRAL